MRKHISLIFGAICFISLFLGIGVIGSIECEMISISQGITTIFIYITISAVSSILSAHFDD